MLGQSPPERLSPELYPPDFPFPLYPFTTSRACLPLTYLKSTLSPSKSMQPPKPSPPHPVLRALAASVASLMITCAFLQGPRPLPLVWCLWPPPKPLQYVDQEGADPLLPSLPYFIASCPPNVHVSQVISFAPLSLLTTPQAHLPHSCRLLISPHSFLLVPTLATQTRLPAVACCPRVAPTHVVNDVQHCSHPLPISLPCPLPSRSLRTTASPSLSLSCSCLSAPHYPTFATYPAPPVLPSRSYSHASIAAMTAPCLPSIPTIQFPVATTPSLLIQIRPLCQCDDKASHRCALKDSL